MILKYKNRPSITAIKNARNGPGFYFCGLSVNNVFKEIKRLKARKNTQITDIPVKILKENAEVFSAYICGFFKGNYKRSRISCEFKKWRYHSCFKKGFKRSKENYRPVSILPVI